MVTIKSDGARPCQLLASVILQAHTWLMLAHTRREQVRLQIYFNVHTGRDKAVAGLFMVHLAFKLIVCSLFSNLFPSNAGILCSIMVLSNRCWLLLAFDFGIELSFSRFQPCSLSPPRDLSMQSRLPPKFSSDSTLSLHHSAVVRHRMRSRHGGCHGGRARPQMAQSVDQPLPPASLPSSQENSPPPSPSRRPFPHNAFQTTHFKFQSSLNRPIITENITIIFSEEEAQMKAPTRTMAEQPQGVHRTVGVQNLAEEGLAERRGDQHGGGDNPGKAQPPGGSSHDATISMTMAGSSSGTRPAEDPPGGSEAGVMVRDGEIWYGNACPIIEEPMDPM